MKIGLTGGMGCGKSTAAAFFADRGFLRFDSDATVRDVLLRDPRIVEALRARWGAEVVQTDGAVNRPEVARRIFADDGERLWLEALLHPGVQASWRAAMAERPGADWIVEVPLLFEKELQKEFDFTVCVAASWPVQLARLTERGIPQTLAGQRISKQLPLAQKTELSDYVLSNDGTRDFLAEQIDLLVRRLRAIRRG